jgi:hypothetical protein
LAGAAIGPPGGTVPQDAAVDGYLLLGLFAGGAEKAETVGAGFFLIEDFGFFVSRLDRCCPLATLALPDDAPDAAARAGTMDGHVRLGKPEGRGCTAGASVRSEGTNPLERPSSFGEPPPVIESGSAG